MIPSPVQLEVGPSTGDGNKQESAGIVIVLLFAEKKIAGKEAASPPRTVPCAIIGIQQVYEIEHEPLGAVCGRELLRQGYAQGNRSVQIHTEARRLVKPVYNIRKPQRTAKARRRIKPPSRTAAARGYLY